LTAKLQFLFYSGYNLGNYFSTFFY